MLSVVCFLEIAVWDGRASEKRARVKITPREKRRLLVVYIYTSYRPIIRQNVIYRSSHTFFLLGADFLFTYVVALAYQNCVYQTERKQSLI